MDAPQLSLTEQKGSQNLPDVDAANVEVSCHPTNHSQGSAVNHNDLIKTKLIRK